MAKEVRPDTIKRKVKLSILGRSVRSNVVFTRVKKVPEREYKIKMTFY